MATVVLLLVGACSTDLSDPGTTATNPTTATTFSRNESTVDSNDSVGLPTYDVALGDLCSDPGRIGLTPEGVPILCSGLTAEGSALDSPVWRETAGGGLDSLSDTQAAAVQQFKGLMPEFAVDDVAILVLIEEFAQASQFASDSGLPIEGTVVNLINGYAGANSVSVEQSVRVVASLLSGVAVLLDEDDPGRVYSLEMIDWMLAEATG
jgi:hypothetical protein